jgi:hypothetical protein
LQFAFFVGFKLFDGEGGDGTTRWMYSREDVRVVAFVDCLVDSAIRSTADEADDIIVVVDMPMWCIRGIIHFGEWRRIWSL